MNSADISAHKRSTRKASAKKDPLKWWRDSRFGMFIHWGLYAIPAGVWKGKRVPYIGEWLMYQEKIPFATYEKLAPKFNPQHFDAAAWVQLAKDAGMRYLTITTKHHDGFAMYHSKVSSYNIVERTPFARDPMKELVRECKKQRIKLCFYYSQDIDWHHPDGAWNTWDFDEKKKNPEVYLKEKVFPQLRELLTQYGLVGMIWFDTPMSLSSAQTLRIRRFVKKLQPDCLVSGRIGHGHGDYNLPRDNFLPPGRLEGDWETGATLNDTWGYKKHDHAWKAADNLITTLVDLASKNSNYLLNIGPDADGVIPAPSAQRLRKIGAWLKINGQTIYGSSPSPFINEFSWGRITTKGSTLYCHFFTKPPRYFRLHGLKNQIKAISPLADPKKKFAFRQIDHSATATPILAIDFADFKTTEPVTVIALKLAEEPRVLSGPIQQPDDSLTLIGPHARVGSDKSKPKMRMGATGLTENWCNADDWLEWKFTVLTPGTYDNTVVTTHQHLEPWCGGQTVQLTCGDKQVKRITKRDIEIPGLRSAYYPQLGTRFGTLKFEKAGTYKIRLQVTRPKNIKDNLTFYSDGGMQFSEIRLTPNARF
jgi:alpha-L-fucosidase